MYENKWRVAASVSLGVFLGTIDGSIVNIALPTLQKEFNAPLSSVQWIVLAYLLTIASLTLMVGRLGDMYGKKRIYTSGFAIFTIASGLTALSSSVAMMIALRMTQAVGAVMIIALGAAILTEAFPPTERGKALGLIGATVSVGIVLGPSVGGVLLSTLGWPAIFLVNVPIGIVGTITAYRNIPDTVPKGREPFDLVGASLMFATMLTLFLGITLSGDRGFDATIKGLLLIAAVCGGGFIWWERKTNPPMIELSMFRNVSFSVNLVTGLLSFVAIGGLFFLLPFYLADALGIEPRQMGLILAVSPIILGVASPVSGALADRIGARPLTVAGLLITLLGYLALTTLSTESTPIEIILRMMPIGLGMGVFQSPNNSLVMGAVRPERLGIASGLLSVSRTVGQLSGVSILGAWWAYRSAQATGTEATRLVAGLSDSIAVMIALITFALGLSVWAWWRERTPDVVLATGRQ